MYSKNNLLFILLIGFLISSCTKPDEKEDVALDFDIWVLNEGLWNMNNSSLTAYNSENKHTHLDIFKNKNGRNLGDVANDIVLYGSKVYIVLNESGLIEVVDMYTVKSITQIIVSNEKGVNRQPRCLSTYKGNVYVCCFDGSLIKIDTTSLTIKETTKAGSNPDGICVVGSKLYVSNSGGLNYPDYGNTVSVFDLNTFTEIKKIEVAINPTLIKANTQGDVFVLSNGNYEDVEPCLQRIDSKKDIVLKRYDFKLSNFDILDNLLYFYHYDYVTNATAYKIFDLESETMLNYSFIRESVNIKIPHSININPHDYSVVITDALDYQSRGEAYCFDKNGKLTYHFETGLCPKKTIFLK